MNMTKTHILYFDDFELICKWNSTSQWVKLIIFSILGDWCRFSFARRNNERRLFPESIAPIQQIRLWKSIFEQIDRSSDRPFKKFDHFRRKWSFRTSVRPRNHRPESKQIVRIAGKSVRKFVETPISNSVRKSAPVCQNRMVRTFDKSLQIGFVLQPVRYEVTA